MSLCDCGSQKEYDLCCGPFLAGGLAPTAEALMRSRYTAYVKGALDYLERTATAEALADFNRQEVAQAISQTTWLGLQIVRTVKGQEADNEGQVEFTYSYSQHGQSCAQRELSNFCRVDGAWLYSGSEPVPKETPIHVDKQGRNDPCACGSGKKYKKCCGA